MEAEGSILSIPTVIGAVSSFGRASGLHPEGGEFESRTVHHILGIFYNELYLVKKYLAIIFYDK